MKKYLLTAIAAGLVLVLAGLVLYQANRINALEQAAGSHRLSSLRQGAECMDELTLQMEKALLATDPAYTATLLNNASRSAGSMQLHLSALPAEHQSLAPALHFLNQLSAYTASLLPHLVERHALTGAERDRLAEYLALSSQLSSQLALVDDVGDLNTLRLDLPEAPSDIIRAKGLPQGEITQEEAMAIARAFVGDSRVTAVQTAPGTAGTLPAYGVTVQAGDLQLNLEVTRQAGKVLWMMPETASFATLQSPQTCRDAAAAFLENHGFAPMEAVYHQVYDGLCVVSLAPAQQGVLLYPDLVRVQVRMDTAEVVGLEAHNYWLNHTARTLPEPAISMPTAREPLLAHARVTQGRLCLIPSVGAERLCYEFSAEHDGRQYLIYIDALTGGEVETLKIVPVENGVITA